MNIETPHFETQVKRNTLAIRNQTAKKGNFRPLIEGNTDLPFLLPFLKNEKQRITMSMSVISVTFRFGIYPLNLFAEPFPKIIVRYYGKVQFTAPVVQSSLDF